METAAEANVPRGAGAPRKGILIGWGAPGVEER